MNQKSIILGHLKRVGSISAMEAIFVHGITRLAARICELKGDGVLIDCNTKHDTNGRRYTRYSLTA